MSQRLRLTLQPGRHGEDGKTMTSKKPSQPLEPEWEAVDPATGERPDKTVMMPSGGVQQALAVRPSATADAFFLVCMGPNVGHKYPLKAVTLLGRSESADITLADDRVSGRHCEVARTATGYRVKDLGSSNGTLVNAQKITETELREGDLVQVGYTVFKFQSGGPRVDRIEPHAAGMGGMGMGGMGMSPMGMGGMGMGGMGMSPMGMGGMGMSPMGMGMQPMGMPMNVPQVVVSTAPPPAQAPSADEEMNLEEMVGNVRKIVDFFLPYKKMIGIAGAVGVVVGIAMGIAQPPPAKATFKMNILTGGERGQGGVAQDRAQAAKSTFESTVLIAQTLKSLGETNITDDTIAAFQKRLTFETTTPNFGVPPPVLNFNGEYQDATTERALLFLQTHVKTFIDNEVEKTTKVITSKLDYLKSEIAKAEETLKTNDEELKEFKKKYLASLPENAAKSQEFVFELQKTESELASGIEQLKLEIQSASSGGSSRKARLVKQVEEELAELKSQGLGDNHPEVQSVKQRLARTQAAPDDAGPGMSGNKSVGQMKAEMAAKTQLLESTRKQLETVRAAQASLPDFEARYADLTRSYEAAKKNFDQLYADKNQTEYTLGFEKTAAEARFEITDKPRAEAPSRAGAAGKKVAMGTVGGIVLGFALAGFLQILKIWRKS
jgi:hypothetical protein